MFKTSLRLNKGDGGGGGGGSQRQIPAISTFHQRENFRDDDRRKRMIEWDDNNQDVIGGI